jgi:hypothetical protein
LKVIIRSVNDGVTTIKAGHQTIGNVHMIKSDELSFTLFPISGIVYIWRTPKEAYNLEWLVPTVKHGRGSVMVWAAISWYSTVKPRFIVFVGGPEKKRWLREKDRCGAYIK